MRHGRAALVMLALCASLLLFTGCAARTTPSVVRPTATKIAARSGDTSLCAVVSPATFTRVTGISADQVAPGATDDALTGLREVYCIYIDGVIPGETVGRGTINYEIAADHHAATTIYQTVRRAFVATSDVHGLGDAAFAGTPAGAEGGTGLIVVKGALLLYLSVGGDPQTVAHLTTQLAALILSRVSA